MSMIHERIQSLSDIDFDYLFYQSLPRMDTGTYPWPREGMTYEEKYVHVRDFLLGVTRLPNFFGFRGVLDDHVVSAHFGFVQDGEYHGTITLVGPDAHGSRSYVYRPDVKQSLVDFIKESGFTAFVGYMPKNSPLRQTIPVRHPGMEDTYEPTGDGNSRPRTTGIEKFKMF